LESNLFKSFWVYMNMIYSNIKNIPPAISTGGIV
jgi:hypothetical protein